MTESSLRRLHRAAEGGRAAIVQAATETVEDAVPVLAEALNALITVAEQVLHEDAERRARTIQKARATIDDGIIPYVPPGAAPDVGGGDLPRGSWGQRRG